eukprot:SAG11_NODE_33225_length_278_cov_1.150838_1_plen_59_part_10
MFALDHDDGSSFYSDTENILVYGGCKQHGGTNKSCGPNNVVLAFDTPSLRPSVQSCITS